MSHRKAYSQGSIPFSWEDKPGVCKAPNNNGCPLNIGGSLQAEAIDQKSPNSTLYPSHLDKKIPLPPCPLSQPLPPFRSTSGKGFKWEQDPFLLAYKECGKNCEKNDRTMSSNNKKSAGSNFSSARRRGKYYMFSCRNSSDVRDDSYLKLSRLPRLPDHRNPSLTLQDEHKPGFNYESSWL
ncbi:hypothetical protein RIF29_32869 [Crotalaria pallida]|uniref:Uncharacterized protein n=1 Tax=Crotalaria pallida TaxID=3830 RepID=A0AAN9HSN4_CROPI